VFGGVKSCGGGGTCIGGYLLCLWVKIEWVYGGIMADRWWVSLGAWVILAWVSLTAWFRWVMVWRLFSSVVEIGVELWWLWKISMELCV